MQFTSLLITAVALVLPIAAQTNTTTAQAIGTNCNIVANHTVVAGDGLVDIGTAAGNVSLSQLLFVNPQISNPRNIGVGDKIAIPNAKCVAPAAKPLAEPTATCVNGTEATTKVASGDTLIIIAKEKLGITLPALESVNKQITDPSKVEVGELINVPLCGTANATISAAAGAGNVTKKATARRNNMFRTRMSAKVAGV